jgi:hypothetical protein
MFIFSAKSIFTSKKELIAFHGKSSEISGSEAGVVSFPTANISVGYQASPTPTLVAAAGQCSFNHHLPGSAVSVDCSATSKGRQFDGVFVSDGKPPG